jgi:hypothetical protein
VHHEAAKEISGQGAGAATTSADHNTEPYFYGSQIQQPTSVHARHCHCGREICLARPSVRSGCG